MQFIIVIIIIIGFIAVSRILSTGCPFGDGDRVRYGSSCPQIPVTQSSNWNRLGNKSRSVRMVSARPKVYSLHVNTVMNCQVSQKQGISWTNKKLWA